MKSKQTEHSQTFDLVAMSRRVQRRTTNRRVLKAGAWGGVAALGLARGGVLGLAVAVFAVDRTVRVLSGRSLLSHAFASRQRRGRFEDRRDTVDEASFQSFPASDPPGQGV